LSPSLPPQSPSQTSPRYATLSGALQTNWPVALEQAALLLTPAQPSHRSDDCCPRAGHPVRLLSVSSDRANCSHDGALLVSQARFDRGEHPAVFLELSRGRLSTARAASAQPQSRLSFPAAARVALRNVSSWQNSPSSRIAARQSRLQDGNFFPGQQIANKRGSLSAAPRIIQNHRMVGVGRDLCGSSSPTPCQSRVREATKILHTCARRHTPLAWPFQRLCCIPSFFSSCSTSPSSSSRLCGLTPSSPRCFHPPDPLMA